MSESPAWLSMDDDAVIQWQGQPRRRAAIWSAVVVAVLTIGAFVYEPVPWGIGVLVAGGTFVAYSYLRLANIEYVLTTRTLYRRQGILAERVSQVPLQRIQNTDLSKGIIGTQLGFGTVTVSTAGTGNDIEVSDIDNPEAFRDCLDAERAQLEEWASGLRGPGPSDTDSLAALVDEARALRKSAESLAEVVE